MNMKLSLAGQWECLLTTELTDTLPAAPELTMLLPGTTSRQRLGPYNTSVTEDHLTDEYAFEGQLWLRRRFTLPLDAPLLLLTLERTRLTAAWLDGKPLGTRDSLCTPHRYLAEHVTAGTHELLLRVSNTGYPTKGGHLTSPDTQSNWLGITGEIGLEAGGTLITEVQSEVLPDLRSLRVRARVRGADSVRLGVEGYQTETAAVDGGHVDHVYRFPVQPPLWSLKQPVTLTLRLWANGAQASRTVGMRRPGTEGRTLLLNGSPVFLRGMHDGMAFPLTGAAPTDLPSWLRYLGTAKEWGMNHVRYHTCCPPEAAFEAADRLGLWLEPELPFWGTVAAPGEEGYNAPEQRYLTDLGLAILREFGSHPSFCMLSMGNELWGSPERLDALLAEVKAGACDKLYTSGSNCFQFVPRVLPHEDVFVGVRLAGDRLFRGSYAMCDAPQGIVQVTEPESVSDYDAVIAPKEASASAGEGKRLIQYGTGVKEVSAGAAEALIPRVPVLSHEIGQYVFYPDFRETDRYTGPLKPRNFEAFRQRLLEKGLWRDHERFFTSAGRLAADCYRRELETALRSEELSGFQLLDLKDFPGQGTALVGVLNAMMESKGILSPEEWRRFCADTVVMARLPRFVLKAGDTLSFSVCVSECEPSVIHRRVSVGLYEGDEPLESLVAAVPQSGSRVKECGSFGFGPLTTREPRRLTLRLSVDEGVAVNEYPLWVFPEGGAVITREGIRTEDGFVAFVSDPSEAAAADGPVIVVPPAGEQLPAEYCADFWCYSMFRGISDWMKKPRPVGTMGLCIDTAHPALAGFPCDAWTTPPWYRLLKHAHCQSLPEACELPVQMIDNVTRAGRLGILWIQDGLLHTTLRLWEVSDEPEARCLGDSLARYLLR